MSDRILAASVAFGTIILAVVTAWLAWDTHHLAQSATADERLRRTVVILRECATASRSDATSGDSLVDLQPSDPTGAVTSDRLSKNDLTGYLKSKADDFVRCEIINAGELPVLDVQIAFTVETLHQKVPRIVSSVFHVIDSKGRRTIWFTNNTSATIVLHSPDSVRYAPYSAEGSKESTLQVEPLPPVLADRWTLRKDQPVQEDLDQREMRPF